MFQKRTSAEKDARYTTRCNYCNRCALIRHSPLTNCNGCDLLCIPFDSSSHICSFFVALIQAACALAYERNGANAVPTCRLDVRHFLLLVKRRNSAPTARSLLSTGLRFSSTCRHDYSRPHLLCSLYAQDLLNTFFSCWTHSHTTHTLPTSEYSQQAVQSPRFSLRKCKTLDEIDAAIACVHSTVCYTLRSALTQGALAILFSDTQFAHRHPVSTAGLAAPTSKVSNVFIAAPLCFLCTPALSSQHALLPACRSLMMFFLKRFWRKK